MENLSSCDCEFAVSSKIYTLKTLASTRHKKIIKVSIQKGLCERGIENYLK